jgi:hypothetical protein
MDTFGLAQVFHNLFRPKLEVLHLSICLLGATCMPIGVCCGLPGKCASKAEKGI